MIAAAAVSEAGKGAQSPGAAAAAAAPAKQQQPGTAATAAKNDDLEDVRFAWEELDPRIDPATGAWRDSKA